MNDREFIETIAQDLRNMGVGDEETEINGADAVDYLNELRTSMERAGYIEPFEVDPDEYPPRCTNPHGHQWDMTDAEADECGRGIRCVYCGADGDA